MPWVRLDDDFYNHPKVIKAGPLGIAMQVAGLCYCNHYLTDGFIPSSIVPGLLNLDGIGMRMWSNEMIGGGEDAAWTMIVEDLVNAGLWELTEGGYMIHDYLDFQPSKAQVMAEREANAKRQEEWRKSHRDGSGKYNANSNAVTNALYNTAPNPVPNPVPNTQFQNTIGANAPASESSSDGTKGKTNKPKTPKLPREHDVLFDTIAEVCCVDPATAGSSIGNVKAALLKAKPPYSADEVKAFGTWYHSDKFRHEKGPPSLWKLKEQIGIVRSGGGNGNKPAADSPSVIEQAILISRQHDEERKRAANGNR